ncbi:T9SS-dependent M36 family metallopeptidase [Neptunitalea lumnitzerae]|uniref:Peptidase M36 n=1 Tax=Neptunitalea lumnitzerae TaxID=2965509 RepID=A0ABQ5MFU7_9FLAO|nr:T9SS-dependent M36 family metallopeptidase [Neptunitalea sp. Y10]GLB48232.1 peptidase M36 [Neptunitalea sp. Y10]
MKKLLTLLILLVSSSAVFAQSTEQKIQNYLDSNYRNYSLTLNDVQDWTIESTGTSKATKITNYYIKQQYQGIDIFRAVSNVWYKDEQVINVANRFLTNIEDKVNTTSANIAVTDAFTLALSAVKEDAFSTTVIENKDANNYLLQNGALTEDPVLAELVFANVNNEGQTLKLAWDFTFYAQNYQHLWSVRIDAVNGEVIEKEDWTISCNFGKAPNADMAEILNKRVKENAFSFEKEAFVKNNESFMFNPPTASYRVLPYYVESPNHGSRQLLTNPENLNASPYGWHDVNQADGAEFTITRGNNVHAQDDPDGDNGAGYSPDAGSTLNFDYAYPGTGVTADTYVDAAVTNLFYMNNIMHDITYQYGFDEPNGNFQQNNYGNGGTFSFFGDYVLADAQDGAGTNNANFSTPVDGNRPRMQMYLWDNGPAPKYLTVNAPSSVAGEYISLDNVFDPGHVAPPTEPNGITADLVLFDDGVGPDTSDACTAATPTNAAEINGNFAIIRRGDCTFVSKVAMAQSVGAIGVIIVNNVSYAEDGENDYVNMSGADASITIPAIFVSKADGEALIAEIESGSTLNVTFETPGDVFINSDGDFDNMVIGHEYGHGVSTRLTGGYSNSSCLGNNEQMGEGWSDWLGLMLQIEAGDIGTDYRGVATFLAGQDVDGGGIRQYPYSTDFNVDPLTLADTNDYTYVVDGITYTDVHSVGTVWASMLWDLTWAYIEKYGFDADIYNGTGGNNKVFQLVLDAMKLQPCNPGFVDGRDAIIAADQATTGGEDYCLIWEVFAARGLGVNASSGSTFNSTDQVEDFTEPAQGPNCTFLRTENIQERASVNIYPNPSTGIFNIEIADFAGDVEVTVFDINGRIVYEDFKADFSAKSQVNLGSLDRGMYIIQLKSNGLDYVTKLMKN